MLDVAGRGGPAAVFVGNIVFHSGRGVNFKFGGVDGGAESCVVRAGIHVVGIVFRVVCVAELALEVISCGIWEIYMGRMEIKITAGDNTEGLVKESSLEEKILDISSTYQYAPQVCKRPTVPQ